MTSTIALKYDGPALETHRMDVRDLAPALLGLADAVEVAGSLAEPGSKVKLDIEATAAGSFEISLLIEWMNDLPNLADTLRGENAQAAVNAAEILGGLTIIGAGVVKAIQIAARVIRHGGKPVEIESEGEVAPLPDVQSTPQVRIRYPDGTVLEVDELAWLIYKDGKAMVGLEKVVSPLDQGEIDTLSISSSSESALVKPVDRAGFGAEFRAEVLHDETTKMLLEVINVGFRDSKWRVSDGDAEFSVEIEDKAFLRRVRDRQETFADGDMLLAEVRTVQRVVNVRPRTDRYVVTVLRHDSGVPRLDSPDVDS
ncbi:hypothetical protein [Demequina globuliformis]|uniref:hypothetical protein n=1 Tax=Demequina globuliformis TaxID=676202 RepID=UPI0007830B65|nr:hypothetical protein [Demequina globuliformis]